MPRWRSSTSKASRIACPPPCRTQSRNGWRWPGRWFSSPRLLLLDEPASGLSDAELLSLGDLLGRLKERMGVLHVEHRMEFVMSVCDRVVVLNFGTVIATGTPDDVKRNPAVAAAYLGGAARQRGRRRYRPRRRGTMFTVEGLTTTYGAIEALHDVSFTVTDGPDHRRPRLERCREDDAPAIDHRPRPPAGRPSLLRRQRPHEASGREGGALRRPVRTGRPERGAGADGRGEPAPRCLVAFRPGGSTAGARGGL